MGLKTPIPEIYTLQQLEEDLNAFYQYCKEIQLTDKEIAVVCNPLTSMVRKTRFKKFLTYLFIVVSTASFVYLLSYSSTVAWHYTAVSRILMSNVLPMWNWERLKSSKCLVDKISWSSSQSDARTDCTFCEYIDRIAVVDSSEVDAIYQRFIKVQRPTIVGNAFESWAVNGLNVSFTENLLKNSMLASSYPCHFSSNFPSAKSRNLIEMLKNVHVLDTYFYHFQNCEFEAVKEFRRYFPRPGFLVPEISPVQLSWILVSNAYSVQKMKVVQLEESIAIVGQFKGSNVYVLRPPDCEEECTDLRIDLESGEALVLTSPWNLEYKPLGTAENVAVILEAH